MPDPLVPNPTAFPTFPTTYGQSEQDRLKQLQGQTAEMQKLWQNKFSPNAWAGVNPLEKAV